MALVYDAAKAEDGINALFGSMRRSSAVGIGIVDANGNSISAQQQAELQRTRRSSFTAPVGEGAVQSALSIATYSVPVVDGGSEGGGAAAADRSCSLRAALRDYADAAARAAPPPALGRCRRYLAAVLAHRALDVAASLAVIFTLFAPDLALFAAVGPSAAGGSSSASGGWDWDWAAAALSVTLMIALIFEAILTAGAHWRVLCTWLFWIEGPLAALALVADVPSLRSAVLVLHTATNSTAFLRSFALSLSALRFVRLARVLKSCRADPLRWDLGRGNGHRGGRVAAAAAATTIAAAPCYAPTELVALKGKSPSPRSANTSLRKASARGELHTLTDWEARGDDDETSNAAPTEAATLKAPATPAANGAARTRRGAAPKAAPVPLTVRAFFERALAGRACAALTLLVITFAALPFCVPLAGASDPALSGLRAVYTAQRLTGSAWSGLSNATIANLVAEHGSRLCSLRVATRVVRTSASVSGECDGLRHGEKMVVHEPREDSRKAVVVEGLLCVRANVRELAARSMLATCVFMLVLGCVASIGAIFALRVRTLVVRPLEALSR